MATKPSQSKSKQSRAPSRQTSNRILVGGLVLLAVIVVGVFLLSSAGGSSASNITIDGVQHYVVLSADHVEGTVNYPQTPPVGGPHNAIVQNCGVYTQPLINEHAVHALEHGAVWITYQPSLPADQLQKLQDITRQSSHRLLSPYPGIDSPIILSAWGYQLKLQTADDPRLMQFIQKYEQGPTTPELGAPCSGGTSATAGQ